MFKLKVSGCTTETTRLIIAYYLIIGYYLFPVSFTNHHHNHKTEINQYMFHLHIFRLGLHISLDTLHLYHYISGIVYIHSSSTQTPPHPRTHTYMETPLANNSLYCHHIYNIPTSYHDHHILTSYHIS